MKKRPGVVAPGQGKGGRIYLYDRLAAESARWREAALEKPALPFDRGIVTWVSYVYLKTL